MTTSAMVQSLQQEAASNNLFKAICLVFASRERARNQVTVVALKAKLKKEGWAISYEDCEKALLFLAELGVGTLQYHPKKPKVLTGLVNIKLKLQDLGKAALNQGDKIARFKPHTKYISLKAAPAKKEVAPEPAAKEQDAPVAVHVTVGGQDIMFPVFSHIAPEKLGTFLVALHRSIAQLEG